MVEGALKVVLKAPVSKIARLHQMLVDREESRQSGVAICIVPSEPELRDMLNDLDITY